MGANLEVGKAIKALANLTTPFTTQTSQTPWGIARRRNACSLSLPNTTLYTRSYFPLL